MGGGITGEAYEAVERELNPGEQLLWAGRPRQGIMFRSSDAALIPFSLMWGGGAIIWEAMTVRSNAPLLFRLWGIPFVLMGLYFIFGRFLVDSSMRAAIYYGLTNQRILIKRSFFSRNITSLELRNLGELKLSVASDGTGTIDFDGSGTLATRRSFGAWTPSTRNVFEGIADARTVYERIRTAQRAA